MLQYSVRHLFSLGARTLDATCVSCTRMTSYVAHHTKKKQILARKEMALQRFIDAGAPVLKLVAAAEKFGLPIHAVGVGETINDLRPFDANELARAIAGVTN